MSWRLHEPFLTLVEVCAHLGRVGSRVKPRCPRRAGAVRARAAQPEGAETEPGCERVETCGIECRRRMRSRERKKGGACGVRLPLRSQRGPLAVAQGADSCSISVGRRERRARCASRLKSVAQPRPGITRATATTIQCSRRVHAAGESFEPYENQRKRELTIRRANKPRHGCERASARVDECKIRMGSKMDWRGERTYGTQPRSQATRARACSRAAWRHPPRGDTRSPATRPAVPAVPSPSDFTMNRNHPREHEAGSRPV
jgi:hypothetical protein